ncbi:hypothetical protein IU449_26885 [Nocardia higoensis]|uniref:Uncharacterized protein n=1 Tax=Nocardia higoensis TaxID=228599 RepID=A0ABS0DI43_9NOCA|nr:hypothetical protein [Nocardia higoensis]MBF6358126.1 hypothetical protein [Nocardia higoensis]
MIATARETVTLTGITRAHGVCACCGRSLGRVFQLSDGQEYGRRCAAKVTGFKITDQAVRLAEVERRNRIAAAELSERSADWAKLWGDAHPAAWDGLVEYRDGGMDAAAAVEFTLSLVSRGVYAA